MLRVRRPVSAGHTPTLRELSLRSAVDVVWHTATGRPAREPLGLA